MFLLTNSYIFAAYFSALKVIKRKAPAPHISPNDIAISRPIAPCNLQSNHGLIPPPPQKPVDQKESPPITNNASSDISNTEISVKGANFIPRSPAVVQKPNRNIDTNCIPSTNNSDQLDVNTSTKKHSPSPTPSHSRSPSPLRPYRKIEDVTTVKRQPKTGWL